MLALGDRGFVDVHGVEASKLMLDAARIKLIAKGHKAEDVDSCLHMVQQSPPYFTRTMLQITHYEKGTGG